MASSNDTLLHSYITAFLAQWYSEMLPPAATETNTENPTARH